MLLAEAPYSVRFDAPLPALYQDENPTAQVGEQLRLTGATSTSNDAVLGCPASGAPFIGDLRG